MDYAPPYIGKLTAKYEMELLSAEKLAIKYKKKWEFAEEYKAICKKKLDEAKKKDK